MIDQDRREEATAKDVPAVVQAGSQEYLVDADASVQSTPEARNENSARAHIAPAEVLAETPVAEQAEELVEAEGQTESEVERRITMYEQTEESVVVPPPETEEPTAVLSLPGNTVAPTGDRKQPVAESVSAEVILLSETEPLMIAPDSTPDDRLDASPAPVEVSATEVAESAEHRLVDADLGMSGNSAPDGEPGSTATANTAAMLDAEEAPGASFIPVKDQEASPRPRRLKDLEVGTELEGRVTSIALYGIFVDVGVGRDGLVHISEMSDTRIESPSDLVQIGDTVKVRVKGLDVDARRISLTMRTPRERANPEQRPRSRPKRADVDREALALLKVGDVVEGVITGMASFGAFADIGVGKDGLVHISELSEGRVDRPEDAVQVGERYTFKLLEIDPEGTRISLSLRRAQRTQKLQQLEVGQILEGTVSGLAAFGAFVDINVGRDGLVHISELSEGRVDKVEDVVQVGQRIKVRVLEVDPQSKRISLTMRLEDRPPEPESPPPPTPEERRRPTDTGGRRSSRAAAPEPPPVAEPFRSASDPDEEFSGNATLEDLLSKFGGNSRRKERRHRSDDDDDEEDRFSRRQREAHRRTLQRVGDNE